MKSLAMQRASQSAPSAESVARTEVLRRLAESRKQLVKSQRENTKTRRELRGGLIYSH